MWRTAVLAIRAEGEEQRRDVVGGRQAGPYRGTLGLVRAWQLWLFYITRFIPSECAAYVRTISRLAQQRDAWDCGDGGCQWRQYHLLDVAQSAVFP